MKLLAESPTEYGIEMVKITGGTFQMGSESGKSDETPVHRVSVETFYLGKAPVTVEQFQVFVTETGYRTEAERGDGSVVFTGRQWELRGGIYWDNPGFEQANTHPVTCVSWNDCQAFIRWLNAKTGRRYRLPTEAEWKFAARAGGSRDCQGDLDCFSWYQGNSNNSTHPVGLKQPNAFGLYDMIGNVWEWCADWYGSYSTAFQRCPTGPECGSMRVNRGGVWYGADWSCLSRRGKNTPDDRGNGLGFRLAEEYQEQKIDL